MAFESALQPYRGIDPQRSHLLCSIPDALVVTGIGGGRRQQTPLQSDARVVEAAGLEVLQANRQGLASVEIDWGRHGAAGLVAGVPGIHDLCAQQVAHSEKKRERERYNLAD